MRKLLNSLYILDETAYLSLDGENIVCKSDQKEKFRLPLSTIEEIFCFSYLGCSPALMGKCLENAISISFISPCIMQKHYISLSTIDVCIMQADAVDWFFHLSLDDYFEAPTTAFCLFVDELDNA